MSGRNTVEKPPRRAVSLEIEVVIAEAGWRTALPDIERHCAAIGDAVVSFLPGSGAREVSLLLCDDATIRALNHRFRGQDKATNVLSFPAGDDATGGVEAGAPTPLGDIAIALGVTRTEAEQHDRPLGDHFAHLLVHGLLHLAGHDHMEEEMAEAMEALERRILATLAIADPYR